jgi:protein gp37
MADCRWVTCFDCRATGADPADVLVIIDVMQRCPRHVFQVLTKRPEHAAAFLARHGIVLSHNIWLGVSVESANYKHRIDTLRSIPSQIRFLSIEPLLGPVGVINLDGVSWVITGGESGPGARPCDPDWVREVRDQCVARGVAYFHKQWGKPSNNPSEADGSSTGGGWLDGVLWRQYPKAPQSVRLPCFPPLGTTV